MNTLSFLGAVYGTFEAVRYKVPGLLKIRHIGQTTVGSAAIFGLFLGAGSLIHWKILLIDMNHLLHFNSDQILLDPANPFSHPSLSAFSSDEGIADWFFLVDRDMVKVLKMSVWMSNLVCMFFGGFLCLAFLLVDEAVRSF
ncbi:hypothetical protein V2J09_003355 [Rumex salicifolius]